MTYIRDDQTADPLAEELDEKYAPKRRGRLLKIVERTLLRRLDEDDA